MMNLPFFENGIDNGYIKSPDAQYRELQQAFQDEQWDNTTARHLLEEQDKFGPLTFHKVEAWLGPVVGMTSTGLKNGDDFLKVIFRDINHECTRGRYYRFNDQYWIGDFTDEFDSVQKSMSIRRCNNFLQRIDPENGAIFSIPCVVDYDMTSPSIQVSRYVITPNNCAHVMVQGNEDVLRLFTLNTRVILSGRPFKLYSYQNALQASLSNEIPNMIYMDFYLDEIHDGDDLVNQIADNGKFDYRVKITSENVTAKIGSTDTLKATVALNGEPVSRQIIWKSSDVTVVPIEANGTYRALGNPGDTAVITATLYGNEKVQDNITVTIGEGETTPPVTVIVNNLPTQICQYENIDVQVVVWYLGDEYSDTLSCSLTLGANGDQYIGVQQISPNTFRLTGLKIANELLTLNVEVENISPSFSATTTAYIRAVSMLG